MSTSYFAYLPSWWKNVATTVLEVGMVALSGGCNACLSPAPIEKRTCGPPGYTMTYIENILTHLCYRIF